MNKKKLLALLMALVMTFSLVPVTAFATEVSTNSSEDFYVDSENSSLYHIANLNGLKAFRDSVNNGNTYKDMTVQLDADINLSEDVDDNHNQISWVPIGKNAAGNPKKDTSEIRFDGSFNGNNHTISNLMINDPDLVCAGLFGIAQSGEISNLRLNNVDITAKSWIGSVVGFSYSDISNCHVTGTIDIDGHYMQGGIVGQAYNNITNCSVNGGSKTASHLVATYMENDLEADKIGGIIGHWNDGKVGTMSSCSVANITIAGSRDVGGMVGYFSAYNTLQSCSVSDLTITINAPLDYATSKSSKIHGGGVLGSIAVDDTRGSIEVSVQNIALTVENAGVEAIAKMGFVSGGMYSVSPMAGVSNVTDAGITVSGTNSSEAVQSCDNVFVQAPGVTPASTAVAEIGDNQYDTLAEDIAAVPTNGTETTITMIDDSVEPAVITIAAGKNIILDLAGHTISYVCSDKEMYFITNEGTLTVQDLSAGETGKITAKTTNPDTGYSKENVTLYNLGGTLNLKSGTIENTTTTGLAYAINNSSNAWGTGDNKETVFNMSGGVVSAPNGDAAIRIYQNCADRVDPISHNTLNITGGTVLDTGIFVDNNIYQATSATTGEGILIDLNITGGTINGLIDLKLRHTFNTSLDITDGDFTNAKLRVRKQTDSSHVWNVQGEPTDPIVTISGGKWSFADSANAAFNISTGWTTTSSWTSYTQPYYVTGGVFNKNLNDYDSIKFEDGKTGIANTAADTMAAYPYTVGAAASPVAQIGDQSYETVKEAIEHVASGETINVIADSTENELLYGVTANALKGKTVTITGSNTLTSTSPSDNRFGFYFGDYDSGIRPSDVLNVNGITLARDGGNYNTLFDGLTANLTGVTITGNGNTALSYANGARGTLTDVTVTNTGSHTDSWRNAALTVQGIGEGPSVMTVKSGTYTSANGYAVYIFSSGGTVNIEGGTFQGALCANIDRNTYHNDYNQSIINISGGTFTNVAYTFVCTGSEDAADYAKIVITGGTFDTDPTNYVAAGYEAVKNGNGTWTVVPANSAVAQIGNVKYATLDAAIADAVDGNTITLLKDIDVDAPIMISKSITIDGGNHTITTTANRGFRVDTNSVNVTIKNLEIGGAKIERAIQVDIGIDDVTLTIDHVTATATLYTVNIQSEVDNLTMNITDSNLTGWAAINSYCSDSRITVSGSTLHGINVYSAPTNDFATIVLDGGSLVGLSGNSTGTILTITDCTIIAEERGTNKQYWISYQYGATNNAASVVSVEGTSILDGVNGNDKTSSIYIAERYNVITMALTEAQKTAIEAAGYTVDVNAENPTKYDISLDPEVHYYWNDENGNLKGSAECSFNDPFENGWLVEGEFIRLEKDVALTKNLSNDYSYSLLLNGKTINAGNYTIQIAAGKTVTSDTEGLSFFTAPEGYKIVTGVDETGYTYTAAAITYVAQIGEGENATQYETLQAAIDAAQSGDTITLLQNNDLGTTGVTIAAGKIVTLDLAGYDISGAVNGKLITNEGTLTINNTAEMVGHVYNTDISAQSHDAVYNSGNLTVNNGIFGDSDSDQTNDNNISRGVAIRNVNGTATINGGYFTAIDNFVNGGYAYAVINSGGSMTINNATVYGKNNGNIGSTDGTLTVKGGSFIINGEKSHYCLYSGGNTAKIVVEGGTFCKANQSSSSGGSPNLVYAAAGSIEIKGGNFSTDKSKYGDTNFKVSITGGLFNIDPSASTPNYIADGYEAVAIDNGWYQVGEIKSTAIAKDTTADNSDTEATYTASRRVVDEEEEIIGNSEQLTVTVTLSASAGEVATNNELPRYDQEKIVAKALEVSNADTMNVSINVESNSLTEVADNKITYEVHPVATVTAANSDTPAGTFIVTNDMLSGQTFTIKLPVPEALQAKGWVKVTHRLNNGGTVEYAKLQVVGGYVTIADVTEFSEFELEMIEEGSTATAAYGFTLALKNKIEIPFYVYNLSEGADNYHVYYSYKDASGNTVSNDVTLGAANAVSGASGWYRVVVASFSARQLRDEVRVILYTGNDKDNTGNQIYNDTYSIYKYCDNMVNNNGTNTESLKTLCKAMMDYGTAAQWNFGYNTENASGTYYYLNNTPDMGSQYSKSFNAQDSAFFYYIGATLSLKSQTELNFYFALRNGNINNYTFMVNGVEVDPTLVGSYYRVTASEITAKNLDKQVTVTVTNNNTNEEESYSYSPLNYAYYIQENSPTDTLKTVCRGLYLYWQAANDYLN